MTSQRTKLARPTLFLLEDDDEAGQRLLIKSTVGVVRSLSPVEVAAAPLTDWAIALTVGAGAGAAFRSADTTYAPAAA